MNIHILGHVCIDSNASEHVSYKGPGSPAMFMARIYKKFPEVFFHIIAPYGSNFSPYCKELNIYPPKPIGDTTLLYENISHRNVRTQKAHHRESAKPLPLVDELKNILSEADILFFAPLTSDYSVEYVKTVMQSIRKSTLKIFLPQGYYRSFNHEDRVIEREFVEASELIPLFDFVVVSEQDHRDMINIIKNWSKNTQVIMTTGDKGAQYFSQNTLLTVPVVPVSPSDIVDSVGSGDIFSASFGYKYYLTEDVKKSLEFANNIARQCLFYKADNLQFTLPE